MPKILITGANGQLGSEFRSLAPSYPGWHFTFTDIGELDVTNLNSLSTFVAGGRFDVLVNCAGYTAVDKAEAEPEKALLLNATAAGNIAFACMSANCFPVHISTDYIFSGNQMTPYREEDPPGPVSTYGITKMLGEENFRDIATRGLILRTSWLYSAFGSNFVRTILNAGRAQKELRVVDDQVGSPTWARDLARHLLEILPPAMRMPQVEIFHYSNEGQCSWYELAAEALTLAKCDCRIMPVRTEDYPAAATRPAYSVLDSTKIKQTFGLSLPHWKDSLKECMLALK